MVVMVSNRQATLAGLVVGMVLMIGVGIGSVQAATLRVAVASNFRPVAQQLANEFSKQTGHRVQLSSASSGVLFNQLIYGAPFDLFLSADVERPQQLFDKKLLLEAPQKYAYGRLVFWQPGHPSPTYDTIKQWREPLAMANPETAPYGLAAQQVLTAFDLWGDSRVTLLQGANIQQTWQYIATGNAKAGFVALSQIRNDRLTQGYLLLRDELYSPIQQDVAILRRTKQPALAKEFVAFLLEDTQQKLIQEAGYYPVRQLDVNSDATDLSGTDVHKQTTDDVDNIKDAKALDDVVRARL